MSSVSLVSEYGRVLECSYREGKRVPAPAGKEGDTQKHPISLVLSKQDGEHELRPKQEVARKPGCGCDHTVAPAEECKASVSSQSRSGSSGSQLLLT